MKQSPVRQTLLLLMVTSALVPNGCDANVHLQSQTATSGKGQHQLSPPDFLRRSLKKDEETPVPTAAPTEGKSMGGKDKDTTPAESPISQFNPGDDDWIDYSPPEDTEYPTRSPTEEPTAEPTAEPTEEPTAEPTAEPTRYPTSEPTFVPTYSPSSKCFV